MRFKATVMLAREALRATPDFVKTYAEKRASGELDSRFKWYGWEGSKEYVIAIAMGYIASDEDIDSRRAICSTCPSRIPHPDKPNRLGFCGPKFDAIGMLRNPPTCGCPIEMLTCVSVKDCPQKRFPVVLTVNGNPSVQICKKI